MPFRVLILPCALLMCAQSIVAQTIEDRVASLESQVAELWQLYDLSYQPGTTVPAELVGNEHLRWGYPGGECELLINEYFVTCHNKTHRVPEWVTYHLTDDNLMGDVERTDNFRPDPELSEEQRAELADYAGSGYDRGHMAPAAAFKRSKAAMSQTFVLSRTVFPPNPPRLSVSTRWPCPRTSTR